MPIPTIIGSYSYKCGPVHAVIEQTKSPYMYGTLCGSHPKIYVCDFSYYEERQKVYTNHLLHNITCKECLGLMKEHRLRAAEINSPTEQKKFFLITYDDESRSVCASLDELHEDMKRFGEEITDILLVESCRPVSAREITTIIDENGKEITKEDMLL